VGESYPAQVINPPASHSRKHAVLLPVIDRTTGGTTKMPVPIMRLMVKALAIKDRLSS